MSSPPSPSLTALAAAVLHVDRNPERILEIACGEGDGVLFLAREFPSARVRGVDSDKAAIHALASKVGLDPEGRVAVKQGKRRSLPYPDDFFDLVVQRHGPLFTSEVVRVLRSGGHLVYVLGRPRWELRKASPMRLRRPLRRAGIVAVQTGEMEGESYFVGRLGDD